MLTSREYYNQIIPLKDKSIEMYFSLKDKCNENNFNKKPSPRSWSAAECLHHLIITESAYLPQLDKILSNVAQSDKGLAPFRKTIFGSIMIMSVSPVPKFKLKAPSVFKPETSGNHTLGLLESFEEHNKRIIKIFEDSSNLNLSALKIKSPASSLIRYNLGETYMIIFSHRLRHLAQAERALTAA